jgi:putative copper resistance protein D
VDAAFVATRAVHFGATMLVFGELVFVALVAGRAWRRAAATTSADGVDRHVVVFSASALALSGLSGLAWVLLEAMQMAGATIAQVIANGTVIVVLRETEFGHVFAFRALVWITLAASLAAVRAEASSRTRLATALLVAAVYLAMLAGAGHAAAASDGGVRAVHVGADALHLLAAGGWLGALPPLVYCLMHAPSHVAVARVARRFSVLGIVCVAALIASGIVNSLFLVGSFAALFGTSYGQLLVVKLVLFAVMLAIAATNRFRLTPRLASDDASRRSLRRNAIGEIAGGLAIVAIVGALGTMVPGAHQTPAWPFDFALDFTRTDLSPRTVVALVVCGVLALAAIALIVTGLRRSTLQLSIAGCVSLLVLAAISASMFAVPAFPTTFAASPVPYAVDPVWHGAARFQQDCSGCHGTEGRGNGPAARALAEKPTDLAEHALHHREGNLFWWIAHGIARTPMPAFSSTLSNTAIWQVVQYLAARAHAEAARSIGARVFSGSSVRVPDFSYELAGSQHTLLGERVPTLVVLYSLPASAERLARLAQDHRLAHAAVRIVAMPIDGSDGSGAFATARVEPNAGPVYAMFAMASDRTIPSHAELLIDANGLLRARWLGLPALATDRDEQVATALEHLPIARTTRSPAHHGH